MADIEGGQPQHKSEVAEPHSSEEQRKGELELYKAALSDDWSKAKKIFEKHGEQIKPSSRINAEGETSLHIATAADNFYFVRNLVDMIHEEDLAIRTQSTEEGNNTAFFYAAASGNVKFAKIMLEKNRHLATIRGRGNNLPIYIAALLGHYQMVQYLYDFDPARAEYTDDDYFHLLVALIDSDIYDFALKILKEKTWLATKTDSNGDTALHAFARKPCIPLSPSLLDAIRAARLRLLNIFGKPKKECLEVVKLLWEQVILEDDKTISRLMRKSGSLIFIAAKQGNYEFLTTLIRSYPDVVFEVDEDNYTIFHIAVLHRHLEIFNLIHEVGSIKNSIWMKIDSKGNNILHLAGKLPLEPSGILFASVAALKMQQELAWFKAVTKIVGPQQMTKENEKGNNEKGKTPMELFKEEHEELRKEGEKWMKNTAKSCMLVSTLVAAMVFAAAFALPGGVGQENGIPILLNKQPLLYFAKSDAVSLIGSASSIFFFLSILISGYSIDDFHTSLPAKLIAGLILLELAIGTMLVAFAGNFSINFKHRSLTDAILVSVSAYASFLLFVFLCLIPLFFRVEFSVAFFLPFSLLKKRSLFRGTHEE